VKKDSVAHSATHWLQEVLGLLEVLWVRIVLFVGKCEFRFRRFKKGLRALATRRKASLLDQHRQSLGYIAQRSNHWAKATNLTSQSVNHCGYKVWLQKKSQPEKHVELQLGCSPTLVLSPTTKIGLGNSNEMCLPGLNLSSNQVQHFIMIWRRVGVCSPQKWKRQCSRMIDFATFCCRWLGNHSFHRCQLKDSCDQAFFSVFIPLNSSSLKIDLHLGFANRQRISAGGIRCFMVTNG
jgi:hypothetical protein